MQCKGNRVNIMNYFDGSGRRTYPCPRDATHAIKFGPGASAVVNGWRPLCRICADGYVGYTVVPINETCLKGVECTDSS